MRRFCLLPLLLLAALLLPPPARAADQAPPDVLKTDVLGVFAHPDDEGGAAGMFAYYSLGLHRRIACVTATRGEGGGNAVGTQSGPALGELREAELRDCLQHMGVDRVYFLNKVDFAYTESAAATFARWNHQDSLARLVRLVRNLRPDVIVTMNPAPTPGQHGNHQAVAILATEAFSRAADPHAFPEQITKEGLRPWQPKKLYYNSYFRGSGTLSDRIVQVPTDGIDAATGKPFGRIAAEGESLHRSQFSDGPREFKGPWRPNTFVLVKSVIPVVLPETDLMAGINGVPLAPGRPQRLSPPPAPPLDVEILGHPAVTAYLRWARHEGVDTALTPLPSQVPMPEGQTTPVGVQVANNSARPEAVTVHFQLPSGWSGVTTKRVMAPAHTRVTTYLPVRAPAGVPDKGFPLTAIARSPRGQAETQGDLLAVPVMRAPRAASPPVIDGGTRGWTTFPVHLIPSTNLVEGTVKGDADSSGRFRVAYDARNLYVSVHVTDDVITTNLAPDDIKAHWRTDSVEVTVDPHRPSENTLTTFKMGIIPWDTAGHVRAERDADANQGPIEETAPGTKLASRRVSGGYVVQAAIPWRFIGARPAPATKLGFDVIIYDADSLHPRIGDNLNKSRIAWAYGPGVWGRPQEWGEMVLAR